MTREGSIETTTVPLVANQHPFSQLNNEGDWTLSAMHILVLLI
jgi:hypothetical protein